MTRIEEIEKEAQKYEAYTSIISKKTSFKRGAEWADNHPSDYIIRKIASIIMEITDVNYDKSIGVGDGFVAQIKEHWNYGETK